MSQSYLNKLKEILLILFQTQDYRYDLETINSLILICKTLVRDDIIKRIRNISILNQFLNIILISKIYINYVFHIRLIILMTN